jgi:hypothetical protein
LSVVAALAIVAREAEFQQMNGLSCSLASDGNAFDDDALLKE